LSTLIERRTRGLLRFVQAGRPGQVERQLNLCGGAVDVLAAGLLERTNWKCSSAKGS
jgi:hypothetical protein